jgi:hypothetical protein
MPRVGDQEREHATALLQRHYLSGRLTVEELAERTDVVLRARSRAQLRAALAELPRPWQNVPELVANGRAAARTAARAAILLTLAGLWAMFSFVLLVALGLTLVFHGASLGTLVGFPLGWAIGTWLLWRLGRRALP